MIKKLLIVIIFLVALQANAQFKIVNDTLYGYGFAGKNSTDFVEIIGETHIIHLGTVPEIIKWVRTVNEFPDPAWTSAVCDIVSCRPPEVDTGSFLFEAGDTGYMSFHFYVKNIKGTGKMVVRFSRANNPSEYVDLVTYGTAWGPLSVNGINTAVTFSSPNPVHDVVNFNNSHIQEGNLEIYNNMGQLIDKMDYYSNISLNLINYPSGIYVIKISNSSFTSFSRIIKE